MHTTAGCLAEGCKQIETPSPIRCYRGSNLYAHVDLTEVIGFKYSTRKMNTLWWGVWWEYGEKNGGKEDSSCLLL